MSKLHGSIAFIIVVVIATGAGGGRYHGLQSNAIGAGGGDYRR